jgi:phage/plasmid-like protein (TIGR03299 family)
MPAFAITGNLDWEVEQRPLFYPDAQGNLVCYQDKVTIVRSDNEFPLGVVSSGYETVQNKDLLKLINPLVEEGILTIHNLGYLSHGAKVFAQAKIAKEFQVVGEDYEAYISLLNGHVGNCSVAIGTTNVRVICSNTFAMGYADISQKFRHSEGVTERVLGSKEVINYVDNAMSIYAQKANQLATAKCNAAQYTKFLESLFNKEIKNVRESVVAKLNNLFRNGSGTEGKTFYDAFNSVTQYSSHESHKFEAARFNYANFGKGSTINQKAMDVALAMVV